MTSTSWILSSDDFSPNAKRAGNSNASTKLSPEARQKTILVVEDHPDIRLALHTLLTQEGYFVLEAGNGQEALDLIGKGTELDLIILDLMMPVMDGYTFGSQLRARSDVRQPPILVMSADGQAKAKLGPIQAKAFLKKPLDIFKLIETVEEVIKL